MALLFQFGVDKLWENLPKMGVNQSWFALGILALIGLFFLAYKALSPGTARMAQEEKERSDTVSVLERENARKDAELARQGELLREQDHKIRELLTLNAGFKFIDGDPELIRLYADKIERQQEREREHKDTPP